MVYSRQTQLFWRSMQPLVHRVVGDALTRCGLRPVVRDAVLHSRCANPNPDHNPNPNQVKDPVLHFRCANPNPDPNPNPSPNPDQVKDPVLHFRCASTPINRKSVYHFPRYGFYRAA